MRVVVIDPFRPGNTVAAFEKEEADIVIGRVGELNYVLLQNKLAPISETSFLVTDAQRDHNY